MGTSTSIPCCVAMCSDSASLRRFSIARSMDQCGGDRAGPFARRPAPEIRSLAQPGAGPTMRRLGASEPPGPAGGEDPASRKTCRKDVCRALRRGPGPRAARRRRCGGFGDLAYGRIAYEFDVDVLEASENNISPFISYSFRHMCVCHFSNLVELLSDKWRNIN